MEHFLRDIEISNFKSIRHQKIEGCKRINLFLGYPNVGKSNILEAIGSVGMFELGMQFLERIQIKDWIRLDELTDAFHEGDYSKGASIKVGSTDYIFYIGENAHSKSLSFNAIVNGQPKERFSFSEIFKLEMFPDRSYPYSPNGEEIRVLSPTSIHPYHFKKHIPFSKENVPYLLYPNGENIIDILSANAAFRKEVSGLFKQYGIKLVIDKNNNELKLTRETEDSIAYFLDYSLIADTLQRLIFYKAAIASNQNAVLLFEEPEAHMFPPYIKLLTQDVVESKTNQFFIATHSPFVLDTLLEEGGEEVMIYLVDFKNGETVVKGLSPEQIAEVRRYGVDLFFNMEAYLPKDEL